MNQYDFFYILVGGGCSIPNAVRTVYDEKGLTIHGIVLNLDGSRYVKDSIENSNLHITTTTSKHNSSFFVSHSDDDCSLPDDDSQSMSSKAEQSESDVDYTPVSTPLSIMSLSSPSKTAEIAPLLRHYAHVCGINSDEIVLENAELCGTNLAVKLMQMGADSILEEIHQNLVLVTPP